MARIARMAKKSTAIFHFRPFSQKQKRAITWWRSESPYHDCDGIIADGAVRSGKTVAFIVGFILWSSVCFNGQNFILAGKSIGTLKRNVIGPMLLMLRALGITYNYNRSENYIEFGGNTYYMFGANNEASQDAVQGLTAAGALLDEVALMPWSFIDQVMARCSVDGSKLWFNCNPENPYHQVKTEIIDKAKDKHFLHLHFTMEDNLTLSKKTRERYERMFFGVWYKRKVLGQWCAATGAIYDMLDTTRHVIPDDKIPHINHYFVGCDYGTSSVTTFWLLGIGSDNLYLLDFWTWDAKERQKQKTDLELTVALENWLNDKAIVPTWIFIPGDAASFIAQLWQTKKERQRAGQPTPLLHLDVADRSPGSVLNGIRDVSTLLGVGKLLFAKSIADRKGLAEMIGYTWDEKAQARGEDAPLKENDHSCDAIRYVVVGAKRWWQKLLH